MWHCGIIMQMRGEFLGNGYMLLLMLLLRTLKLSCAMAGRQAGGCAVPIYCCCPYIYLAGLKLKLGLCASQLNEHSSVDAHVQ